MMYTLVSALLSFGFLFGSVSPPHALYISVVEITHPASSNTNQIKIKVFQDDLQNALKNAFPNDGILLGEPVYPKHSERIKDYFEQHFIFQVNGKQLEFKLQNCEAENDVFWISFETSCPANWSNISVKADFFMELFPTQSNIIRINNGDAQRFMRLNKGNEEGRERF